VNGQDLMSNNNSANGTSRAIPSLLVALVGAFTLVIIGVFIGKGDVDATNLKMVASCDNDLHLLNKVVDEQNKTLTIQNAFAQIRPARPEHMETGVAILEVGRFSKIDEAKKGEEELRKYLLDCYNLNDTWFCHPDLLNMISILKHNEDDYFLVIKGLDMPTLYNLCSFMWVYSARVGAARHGCSQMSLHEIREMGLL